MTVPPRGLVLLTLLTLAWGGNWPAMKSALREIDPWAFRSVCLAVGGVALLALARARGLPLAVRPRNLAPLAVVTLLNITAWHLFSAYGLTLMGAGRASIIGYTMPLWTVLLGWVLVGEPLTRVRVVALLLGLAGLSVLIGPEVGRVRAAPLGALFMLCAALSWAAGTVLMKRVEWSMPTTVLTGWQVLLGGGPVVAGALVLGRWSSLAHASRPALLGVVYSTAVGVVVCHYLWFALVRLLPAAVAAIGVIGIPVVGVFSSALVLGERIGARELAALGLVLPALAVVLVGPGLYRFRTASTTAEKSASSKPEFRANR